MLLPLDSSVVGGTFQAVPGLDSDETPELKISGLTRYDMLFASVEVPFVFYPTEEQTREFIDGS